MLVTSLSSFFSSLFNNVIGIPDPSQLNPPDFCSSSDVAVDSEEEPVDFFSLFLDWGGTRFTMLDNLSQAMES